VLEHLLPASIIKNSLGSDYFFANGRMMPADALAQLLPFDAILLGAIGDPAFRSSDANGLLLPSGAVDQYACVRPAIYYPVRGHRWRAPSRAASTSW